MKTRIHILGGPGSGKSYLAARLATRYQLPWCPLDELYWDREAPRYDVRADGTVRDRELAEFVARDRWVIEGVYYAWLAPSFAAADVIIALTPSRWLRHWRILKRFLARKFSSDGAAKHTSVADVWRLLCWNHDFDEKHLPRALSAVAEQGREVVVCKTWTDVLHAIESEEHQPSTNDQAHHHRHCLGAK